MHRQSHEQERMHWRSVSFAQVSATHIATDTSVATSRLQTERCMNARVEHTVDAARCDEQHERDRELGLQEEPLEVHHRDASGARASRERERERRCAGERLVLVGMIGK